MFCNRRKPVVCVCSLVRVERAGAERPGSVATRLPPPRMYRRGSSVAHNIIEVPIINAVTAVGAVTQ